MKKRPTVDDVTYKELYSIKNLRLAWDRINASSSNLSYKNYFRTLFWYYECDLDSNLECLSKRLENHTYSPSKGLNEYQCYSSQLPVLSEQKLETINHYLKVDFEINSDIDWKLV